MKVKAYIRVARNANRASARGKLVALGLTPAEIDALR